MNIKYLTDIIKNEEFYSATVDAIRKGAKCVHINGISSTVKSLFISALTNEIRVPTIIVTYNYEQAERLYDDLLSVGFSDDELFLTPPADSVIYGSNDNDYYTTNKRLSALIALMKNQFCIVIAPIAAILQKTIPVEALKNHKISIDKSSVINIDAFAKTLVEYGYEHNEMVEKPGEFSIRGGIIDVFPSTDDKPVRIELFGDDVDSIRQFDVESQRSDIQLDSLDVYPARELILTDDAVLDSTEALTGLIDKNSDITETLREKIDSLLLKLSEKNYFDGIEYYLPIMYRQSFTMLDYLPVNATVILDEPHQIESHWEQMNEKLLESLHARIKRGDAVDLKTDHVIPFNQFADRIRHRSGVISFALLFRAVDWLDSTVKTSIAAAPMDLFGAQIVPFIEQLKTWKKNLCRIIIISAQPHRIVELLVEHELSSFPIPEDAEKMGTGIYVFEGSLRSGFKITDSRLIVITDSEMFGAGRQHRPRKAFKKGLSLTSLLELSVGDYIVHINHGIGKFTGMARLSGISGDKEYLLLEYAGGDKLYVPADQIDRVQKYIGSEGHPPVINKLGGSEWARTTKKVKQSVKDMAKDLIALYAERQSVEGFSYSSDTPWQYEMEAAFPYAETNDQLVAISEVKADLESPKPMDRLICGDVGYGKTEVAIRGVFKVINDGKQVAVLAPTTVLAQQHFNTFTERLAAYPINIAMLSRFRSRTEQKKTVEKLRTGEVDVVIGTHRLLSKDIQFRDLGLLVVDEEQRFGVAHKEKLKQFRKSVDVLTLTATPIPRTLHMSLSGIRDMSLINDPPEGRTPVKTFCTEYEDELVRDAILRELDRDGQVYFVHNRVENIEHIANHVRKLVPYARVEVGHGQMNEDELERVMMDYYDHKFDVLVCTTIIESGLDIPNVNTIIINNADKMGLSQLYQLRGRVGRSNRQAYAYLLYEPFRVMTEVAEKRLHAIKEFSDLGSGFKIALRDLEIRGAGNLLGAEQHGQMASVGFDMYCKLLSEAIIETKGEESDQFILPNADLPMDAYLPDSYIPNESLRMSFYKKMTAVREEKDVDAIMEELQDRFGSLPKPVVNALEILRIRLKSIPAMVESITSDKQQAAIRFGTGARLAPDIAKELGRKYRGCIFAGDKILIDIRSPRLIKLIGYILDDLPKALAESKELYLARIY